MPGEVPYAEFEYFQAESVPLDSLVLGSRLMLYACLVEDEVNMQQTEQLASRVTDGQKRFYGKAACTVVDIRIPKPSHADILNTEVDLLVVQFGEENTAQNSDFEVPVMLISQTDTTFSSRFPFSMDGIYKVFFNLKPAFYEFTPDDKRFGNPNLAGCGILLTEGYLVDVEISEKRILHNMMVASGGDDDGSAGALVPARPKGPIPAISREI